MWWAWMVFVVGFPNKYQLMEVEISCHWKRYIPIMLCHLRARSMSLASLAHHHPIDISIYCKLKVFTPFSDLMTQSNQSYHVHQIFASKVSRIMSTYNMINTDLKLWHITASTEILPTIIHRLGKWNQGNKIW